MTSRQQVPSGPTARDARLNRRALLRLTLVAGTATVAAPVLAGVLSGCSVAAEDTGPDPLIALADQARADAALAAAAVAARPALAGRLTPLQEARTEHAAALEREIVRADPARASTAPAPVPAASDTADLAAVRTAAGESARQAAALVQSAPAHRVGLVAAVATCCAAYAVLLQDTAA